MEIISPETKKSRNARESRAYLIQVQARAKILISADQIVRVRDKVHRKKGPKTCSRLP